MVDSTDLDIENSPRRAFVVGWPISHSRSPLIHNHWLRLFGINGTYEKVAVEPAEFAQFIDGLNQNGFVGGNVTLPHKEAAYDHVIWHDEAAQRLGAVNTVWHNGKTLWGSNTDGYGFLANMDQGASFWRRDAAKKQALVIGAGGASRAIIDALVEVGFKKIVIANRTVERAQQLAQRFGDTCTAISLQSAQTIANQSSLIINTTSVGMDGESSLPISFDQVPADCLVTDIIYTPLKTPFLKAAQDKGLATVDGLGMLLHQAVPGFENWFGVRPPVTKALRAMAERDLGERSEPIILGLTGSIGMGKSTTAQMFRDAGIPVYDSDATVHALYEGEAVPLVEAAFPGTTVNGKVDRGLLSQHVVGNEEAMKQLEAIVHPLVHREERAFRETISREGYDIAVLDAPLLFERDNADKVDAVVVVSAPENVQRARVLARPSMTEEKFEAILARQTPDAEKRSRADHILDTSMGLDAAREAVAQLVHIYTPFKATEHA